MIVIDYDGIRRKLIALGSEYVARLTHHVHILEMNGESFRLRQSRKSKT